jgi:ribonuclease HI
LCDRGETPIQDSKQFSDQIDTGKMITMTTDGGANPNPGPAGWGALIRQNGKFLCLWKHYPKSSNNVMELSAVIACLNYLPSGMVIWPSTDSQYVQKGINECMPKWKRNGWRNSKKAGVANKSLWLALEAAIARHRCIEFTWVKAHSGLLHNEIADTLATRGVQGSTYCPIDWFDRLPPDTEEEDDPSIPPTEVITQTEEFGADEEHLPSFGTRVRVYGFNEEEAAEIAEAAAEAERAQQEAERERGIRHLLHDVCGNSSTPVTDDEDCSNTGGTVVITPEIPVVDSGSEQPEPPQEHEEHGFSLQVGHVGVVDMPESVAPSPWSSTSAQARAESERLRAEDERFSWMKGADLQMLNMGLEPVPWEHFADAVSQTVEYQFQAVEQRTCSEQVMGTGEPPGPDSLVGATLVVRSHKIVTALKMVSYGWNAPGATARMLCLMAESLPIGAQLDLIVSTPIVLHALGTCADILTKGWDVDQYCQDPEWKDVMVLWKNRQLHASVREVDEDGLDADLSPFLKLSLDEGIQAVRDTLEGRDTVEEVPKEPEGFGQ